MCSSDENSVGCWCISVHKGGCCLTCSSDDHENSVGVLQCTRVGVV